MIPALKILHVAIAAAWFGHKLLVPGDVRRSLHAGTPESEAMMAQLRRAERLGIVTGLGTLLSGAALAWAVGFDTVRSWIWVGLALVLIAIGMGAMARPALNCLQEAIAADDRVSAIVEAGRINLVLGVESLVGRCPHDDAGLVPCPLSRQRAGLRRDASWFDWHW